MNGIECAFVGKLGQAPELKIGKSGKPWAALNVLVGSGEAATWVRAAAFGDMAEAAAQLAKGASVYIEGTVTLRTWQTEAGEHRSGLNVAASLVQPLGQIGQRRPRPRTPSRPVQHGQQPAPQSDRDRLDDPLPF